MFELLYNKKIKQWKHNTCHTKCLQSKLVTAIKQKHLEIRSQILGRPTSLFRFFHTMLWKTQIYGKPEWTFLADPVHSVVWLLKSALNFFQSARWSGSTEKPDTQETGTPPLKEAVGSQTWGRRKMQSKDCPSANDQQLSQRLLGSGRFVSVMNGSRRNSSVTGRELQNRVAYALVCRGLTAQKTQGDLCIMMSVP